MCTKKIYPPEKKNLEQKFKKRKSIELEACKILTTTEIIITLKLLTKKSLKYGGKKIHNTASPT